MCTSQNSTMPPIGTATMMNNARTCAAESTNSLLAAAHGPAAPSPARPNREYDKRLSGRARSAPQFDARRARLGDFSRQQAIKSLHASREKLLPECLVSVLPAASLCAVLLVSSPRRLV